MGGWHTKQRGKRVLTPGGYPAVILSQHWHGMTEVEVQREGMPPAIRRFRKEDLRPDPEREQAADEDAVGRDPRD